MPKSCLKPGANTLKNESRRTSGLQRYLKVGVYLAVLALPGSVVLLPVIAWWFKRP